jgi:hypothetical protein
LVCNSSERRQSANAPKAKPRSRRAPSRYDPIVNEIQNDRAEPYSNERCPDCWFHGYQYSGHNFHQSRRQHQRVAANEGMPGDPGRQVVVGYVQKQEFDNYIRLCRVILDQAREWPLASPISSRVGSVKEFALNGAEWAGRGDVYASFFRAVGAPAWHGRNFDALRDSIETGQINAIEVPYRVVIQNYSRVGPRRAQHG